MHDIITIGSATIDIFMKSKEFHLQPVKEGVLLCESYGGKLDVDDFLMQSGGAATNAAVGFRRFGFHTAAVVEIGKDFFGQMVWDDLKRERVDTEFVITEKSENTAVSVLLISGEGGRSALTHRGASSLLEARDLPWSALRETRWIHLSNVAGNKELLLRLFDHLQGSDVGLSWTPGTAELKLLSSGELRPEHVKCDMFIINKEEWELVKDVQSRLLKNIQYVIITDGKNGGKVYFQSEYHHTFKAEDVVVAQETGAGDSFCVGFVSAHLLGQSLQDATEWGVRNSASVVQHMGAKTGLLRKKDFHIK